MTHIRNYRRDDALSLEHCIVELQSYESEIEPNREEGHRVAAAYRRLLLAQCRRSTGKILVAEADDEVVGFVCVLAQVDSKDVLEKDSQHAYITDLVVLPGHRNEGVGKALLAAAEQYVAGQGGSVLKVDVLAANDVALDLYTSMGYVENEIRLAKRLDGA
jgi:ribosomal protein S18 acetylase RimI-like enzyme